LVKLDLFSIFPTAFLFTGLGLFVLNVARRQPAPVDA
jgi:hypothetical protein